MGVKTESSAADTDGDVSIMSEDELRRLFVIMRRTHPDALASALAELYSPAVTVSEPNGEGDSDAAQTSPPPDSDGKQRARTPGEAESTGTGTTSRATPNVTDDKTDSSSTPPPQICVVPADEVGCYLLYDADACKLMLNYSKTSVPGAIGFWSPGPGQRIQDFKFKQNFGRAELIGNCASGVAGRKNYYSGWCQFVRAAKALIGSVRVMPRNQEAQGLDVDLYVYYKFPKDGHQTLRIEEDVMFDVSNPPIDAIACLPKHTDFYVGVSKIDLTRWMTDGSTIGAASAFEGGSSEEAPQETIPTPSFQTVRNVMPPAPPAEQTNRGSEKAVENPEVGCYLVYDADACKLMINYSKTAVRGAIGFWLPGPGKKIQGFKFTQNFGRAELIGNCASGVAGRKNYYSGWCQFVRAAKALNGSVRVMPRNQEDQGLDVDLYVYYKFPKDGQQTVKIDESVMFNVSEPPIDAIACVPKHTDFYEGVSKIDLTRWMTDGSTIGAASRFE